MKIKNISCTQFAGIRDKSVSLTDGINVICGKNESGKSTLVNLISRTLFQSSRIDGRSDKEFVDLYFPAKVKNSSIKGDFADGKITFETPSGTYSITKEWGADARSVLSTPEGIVKDSATIDSVLKSTLLYGEGVYSEMLLSPQAGAYPALETILSHTDKSDTKKELTAAVTQAFTESDGITADSIEQAINAKIESISGKHWDTEKNQPMRKTGGRWSNGLGEILKAYYALEDARTALAEISRLENEADRTLTDYTKKDSAFSEAEKAYNSFNSFYASLAVQQERTKNAERLRGDLSKLNLVLFQWPLLSETVSKAKLLHEEKTACKLLDCYTSALEILNKISEAENALSLLTPPTDSELSKIKASQKTITQLENKLCGMNLNAFIKLLGKNSVEIKTLRTGETVSIDNSTASITEAVTITVPDVLELQLSPANVDVSSISARLEEEKAAISDIFKRYNADSLEKLESVKTESALLEADIEKLSSKLSIVLGDNEFTALESAAKKLPASKRTLEEIESDILSITADGDILRFLHSKETILKGYESEYESIESISKKATEITLELEKLTSDSLSLSIPTEYLSISDPEAHLLSLKSKLNSCREARETALSEKSSASGRLESYKENISCDPLAEMEKAEALFNEQLSLLNHWLHIKEVFISAKENVALNPMDDISQSFESYLSPISGGNISSEFPGGDKLDMNIYSGNRLIDYPKLSEGTKATVSLAFRLAVLDHLFPDGGGVIVLDDPFADMDKERTENACRLVKESATRHQVIFLTCHEEYLSVLNGNVITL